MMNFVLSWGILFISAACDVLTMLFVKKRYVQIGQLKMNSWASFTKWLINFVNSPLSIIFMILFFTAPLLWFIALNKINLSIGYPVSIGLRLILVVILSYLFLGEAINFQKVLALVLLFFSLYLLYR